MNIWDILILLLVTGAVLAAALVMRGKKGGAGCSCGCAGCTKECPAQQDEKAKTNR